MSVFEIQVSWFKKLTDPTNGHINIGTIGSLFECIWCGGKDGAIKEKVNLIRSTSDKDARNQLKQYLLPVITWQGIFQHRANDGLVSLSSLICIDIDHRTDDELTAIRAELMTWPFIVAFFRSPSGDGLKVIIKTDLTDPKHYLNCYKQLEKLFVDSFGIEPDTNCEALSQGCFLSYDPDIYVNMNVRDWHYEHDPAFDVSEKSAKSSQTTGGYIESPISPYTAFTNHLATIKNGMTDEQILKILDRKFHGFKQNYTDGYRTHAIFVQASKLCLAGIPQDKAVEYLKSQFLPTGYQETKLVYEAGRGYEKNSHLYGSERGKYLPYNEYKNKKKI